MAIPYIAPLPKGWGSIRRLPLTVFGLINFATKYRALYPFPPVWPQTPNFTISLMYHHFYKMFSDPKCPRAPELNETSDGSPKEYKNVLYMAFACLKVLIDWFHTVNHYFLPPGHSHDLQDQTWATLKKAFYSSRTVTWEQFLLLCQRAFSTMKPEVISKLFVFDWETWLRPWMRKLKNHSHWRAFQFTRSPTNHNSVLMKWKESESSEEPFHGSESHPDGVEILLEVPFGSPNPIKPEPLDINDFAEIHRCFSDLSPEQRMYWEELIAEAELPGTDNDNNNNIIPEDYFDFNKFTYNSWEEQHPYDFQHASQHEPVIPSIEVDEVTGISATGNRTIDLLVGDFVTIRNGELDDQGTPNSFWLGRVRKIVDPPPGSDTTQPHYQIWFQIQRDPDSDIWNFKTKWKADKIKNNPAALGIYTLNHFLTVKFTMTKSHALRKETLKLIRQVLNIDNFNVNNNNNNNTSTPNTTTSSTDDDIHPHITTSAQNNDNNSDDSDDSSTNKNNNNNDSDTNSNQHDNSDNDSTTSSDGNGSGDLNDKRRSSNRVVRPPNRYNSNM